MTTEMDWIILALWLFSVVLMAYWHNQVAIDRDRWRQTALNNADRLDEQERMAEWLAVELEGAEKNVGIAFRKLKLECDIGRTKDEWLKAAADAVKDFFKRR